MSREDYLIERFIEPDPQRPVDARIADYGVPVWALIGYLRVADADQQRVADDYDIPLDGVRAAVAYYKRHRELIDARLALNAA